MSRGAADCSISKGETSGYIRGLGTRSPTGVQFTMERTRVNITPPHLMTRKDANDMPKSSRKRINFKSVRDSVSERAKSARDSATEAARSATETTTDVAKSTVDSTVQGANTVRDSEVARGVRSAGSTTVEGARDAVARGGEVAGNAAAQSGRVVGEGVGSVRQRLPWDGVLPDDVQRSLSSSIESSKTLSVSAKRQLNAKIGPTLESLSRKSLITQEEAFALAQGILASPEASRTLNDWLQAMVDGAPTIYDRAMDATYNATHIGGGYHSLFDGGHTIPGAFQAVRGASQDDNIMQEAAGFLQSLARDATTPMGLPLVNWDQNTFNGLADTLGTFGIPRSWVADMVSYDAVEIFGGAIGVVAVALNWNNDDVEEFTGLVGGMGLSAAVGANPLLLVVTVVALARAFHIARKTGDWKEFADGLAKGGIGTGVVLLATALMPGPTIVVLLTGICVGVIVNQTTRNVSIVEISQFVVVQIANAPTTARSALDSFGRPEFLRTSSP